MTEQESLILEELHFVTAYQALRAALSLDEVTLQTVLGELLEKQWVVQLHIPEGAKDFEKKHPADREQPELYHFLATKAGLLKLYGA